MNSSEPFVGSPPKRGHVLRRGISRLLGDLKPGEATIVQDLDPRTASRSVLNAAKRLGVRVTTRKTSGDGLTVYRLQ